MSNGEAGKPAVLQGTLDLMVLQTLDSLEPVHGYTIEGPLEQVSGGVLRVNMGTLYPALMRLEQRGLVRGNLGHHGQQTESPLLCAYRGWTTPSRPRETGLGPDVGIMHTLLRGDA